MSSKYDNLGALTSPNEFVEHYYNQVKEYYNARGLQISKQGFIGFFLHVLGFNQYDTKYYYDTLFREAFLATADNDDNLKLHASIYGYSSTVIAPSSLVGNLVFFKDELPVSDTSIYSIVITDLKVVVGDVPFLMDSYYSIHGNVCEIRNSVGEITHVPYDNNEGIIPLIDFNQYETEIIEFTLPFYVYGTHYQKIIEQSITDSTVYEYKVEVKLKDTDEWLDFTVSPIKYYATADDSIVFTRKLINDQLLFEFGSGINGQYIPDSNVRITLKYTKGKTGNVQTNEVNPVEGNVFIFNSHNEQIYSGDVSSLIRVQIDYSTGGINELKQDDLRQAIIEYVQTRNNLISKTDFYNILKKHLNDFILLFKKLNIMDNTIYAFVPFKDRYIRPILSKSVSIVYALFNPKNKPIVYKPQFSLAGSDYISPFVYIYDSFIRVFSGYLYKENYSTYFSNIENLTQSNISLPLNLMFDYQPETRNTRIVVQSYQKISDYVMYIDISTLGIYSCMDVYDDNNQEYMYIDDLYDGLIYNTIDVKIHIFQNDVKHYIYTVKDINLLLNLTDILTLGIYEFLPDYSENGETGSDGNGTIGSDPNDPIGWVYTGGTGEPTSVGGDGWFLPQTGFTGMTGDSDMVIGLKPDLPYIYMADFVMHIPVMLQDQYESDPNYYDYRFINSLGQISLEENRMISDDLQVRFLNTEVVDAHILQSITVQKHNFKLKLPLILHVVIGVDRDELVKNNINSLEFKDELINNLATQLTDKYTGVNVSFYRTQIVDIIHDIKWVKYCNVFVYDSTDPDQNEIFEANIELIDQSKLETNMSKHDAATFCPVYIWWDVDNINIELIFE